jgi:hypothetical protein
MSGFTVVSSSEIYKFIISCLDKGRATTKETLVLQKKGVEFQVKFNLSFTYDDSNGMDADEPQITSIQKSNGKKETASEVNMIKAIIKQNYKW